MSCQRKSSFLIAAWRRRRSIAVRGLSLARSNFVRRSSNRRSRANSASMASRVCSLMRPSYSWKPRAVAWSGRAARWPLMYSSATMSYSASGLREEELWDEADLEGGDDLEVGEGEGEAESEEGDGLGEDLCFARGVCAGFSDGLGEAPGRGLTGPVGFKGAEGVGLGEGEGEGAAGARESARPRASARMNRPRVMDAGGIGPSAGRCQG